ncbi:MAG: TonB-dependent receptor, partial [Betaproteobacteria bacterium]|nr:TonB-dependent receptor [Betaproteobacteria bacterium]
VPGVSFQNNDPWGSSGGSFTIRGFSSDRISQTVDGIPLNDSGNYALYTNQQQDPETLQSVNVNLGVTDVDSPTASAVGGTINIRTRVPADHFALTSTLTVGDVLADGSGERSRMYMRGFAMVDTGDFTGMGTKAWFSASYVRYNNPFNNYGVNEKQQYNGRIYQEIGTNGDFISVAGHYNENRNNFFGSVPLRDDLTLTPSSTTPRVAGSGSSNRFPLTGEERFYDINYPCTTDAPQGGVADTTNSCGTEFDRRYNPSNTGNIRGSSRFTLMDGLVLTVDPSYQYVKANGGGTTTGYEYAYDVISAGGRADCRTAIDSATVSCQTGYLGGRPYFGVDLNSDGDTLDQVTVMAPSQTRTNRYGVIANLSYEITPDQSIRISYTHDYANHRQTGQVGLLQPNGEPYDVFPVNAGLVDAGGNILQKRDRQSFAILDQVSGEYRGKFGPVTAVLGLRAPWFTRELNQYCFTTSASGFVDCFGTNTAGAAAYNTANPNAVDPVSRTYKYNKLLPNVGFTIDLGAPSVFFNYAKGLSVPGTDPLYNSLYFGNAASAQPAPETTDSFDLGVRFRSGQFQGQIAGWFTRYDNRLASAYDPILEASVYRNLGRVDKYGVDASLSWRPNNNVLLYVFGSINESDIKDNLIGGKCTSTQVTRNQYGCATIGAGNEYSILTAGKRESGAPTYSFGARGQLSFGDFDFGAQVKYTGKRYVNDENLPLLNLDGSTYFQSYGASAPGYTLVDLDIRYKIAEFPTGGDVAVQLNVSNLFDELYVGGFGGSPDRYNTPFVQIGAPRAASLSLIIGY